MVTTRVVWSDALRAHDFPADGAMPPRRLDLTMRLAAELGVLAAPGVSVVAPSLADDDVLATVHLRTYVDAVRRASTTGARDPARGLGTSDNPVFPGMHQAAALSVGGTVDAAAALARGEADHAVALAGGLHHAMPGSASGFCVYNDVVAAIRRLRSDGVGTVAHVDLDAHHGDGVERAFWDDPHVLTVSVHRAGPPCSPAPGTRPTSAVPVRRAGRPTCPAGRDR